MSGGAGEDHEAGPGGGQAAGHVLDARNAGAEGRRFPRSDGGTGVGVGALVQGAQLMGSLTQLQRGDMERSTRPSRRCPHPAQAGTCRTSCAAQGNHVGAGMGQMDAMTLDIVSMLFDALFDDAKVPLALKGLIGRLQLPMLKVAIADKELFSSKTHPARRLLDTIGQLGMRLPRDLGADSPVFVKIAGFIDELIRVFQENMDVFDATRLQFEAMIAAADAQIALRMQETQKTLEQAERLALAKSEVQDDLRTRRGVSGYAAAVFEFLAQHWIKYLVVGARATARSDGGARRPGDRTAGLERAAQGHARGPPRAQQGDPRAAAPLRRASPRAESIPRWRLGSTALMDCNTAALRAAPAAPAAAAAPAKPKAGEPPALDFTQNVTVDNPSARARSKSPKTTSIHHHHCPDSARKLAVDAPKRQPPGSKCACRSRWSLAPGYGGGRADRNERPAPALRESDEEPFPLRRPQGNKVFECRARCSRDACRWRSMLDGELTPALRPHHGRDSALKRPSVPATCLADTDGRQASAHRAHHRGGSRFHAQL